MELGRIYFKVLEINGDYFYAEMQDPYYQGEEEYYGTPRDFPLQYAVIRFSRNCISEIPISWQNRERREKYSKHLLDQGYIMTGATVQ